MNLTKAAILFALITIPFSIISYVQTTKIQNKAEYTAWNREVLASAVADGGFALKHYAIDRVGGSSDRRMRVDPDEVVSAFLGTYHYGLKAFGETNQTYANQYLVALIIMDYDGFYIYGMTDGVAEDGSQVLRHALSEKIPYLYDSAAYSAAVTLDDQVTVIDKGAWQMETGPAAGVGVLPSADYDAFRQEVIREAVTRKLEVTVQNHNRYGMLTGSAYEFHMPIGDEATWGKGLDDPGLIAVLQGVPLGDGSYLDLMTLNQGDLHIGHEVNGYEDPTGYRYYCHSSCSHVNTDTLVEVFSGTEAAASAGYYPCQR